LTESSLIGVYVIQDGKITYANPSFARIFGYQQNEINGILSLQDLIYRDDLPLALNKLEEILEGKIEDVPFTHRGVKKDGSLIFCEALRTRSQYQERIAIIGTLQDITERRQAEEAIHESEAKYATLVEHSNDGIIIIRDGRFVFVNRKILDITGHTMKEVIGKPFVEFLTPAYKQPVIDNYLRRMKGEAAPDRYDAEIIANNGRVVAVEISASMIEYEGLPAIMAIIHDTTEQKKTWAALREREIRLSSIYDNVSDIIFVLDVEPVDRFRFRSVNRRFLEATGLAENQVVGKLVQEVLPVAAHDLVLSKYAEAIRTGIAVHWEEVSAYPAGTKYGEVSVSPVQGTAGRYDSLIGTVHDITERKKAEEELSKYRDHLENLVNQRTAELAQANLHKSQFLANMSHELRTPLNSIIGYTKLILDGMEGAITNEQKEDLQTVYNNSKHLLSLINDLLDLSKIEAGKYEIHKDEIATAELLGKIVPGMEKLARDKGLSLSSEINPGAEKIYVDQNKTKQVLFNLLGNAVKFTQNGSVRLTVTRQNGEFIFSVSDTGIGIAKEEIGGLFNSYKQVGPARLDGSEGTGLGLVISKQFIELQGGRIWVESTQGKGSTFTFALPEK
jgi:PAS domain S-box-containing protein